MFRFRDTLFQYFRSYWHVRVRRDLYSDEYIILTNSQGNRMNEILCLYLNNFHWYLLLLPLSIYTTIPPPRSLITRNHRSQKSCSHSSLATMFPSEQWWHYIHVGTYSSQILFLRERTLPKVTAGSGVRGWSLLSLSLTSLRRPRASSTRYIFVFLLHITAYL